MGVFLEAIPYLQPFPRISNISKIVEKYQGAIEEAVLGRKTPELAFKDAAREIDVILKETK